MPAPGLRAFVALRPDATTAARLTQVAAIQQARWPTARALLASDLHLTLVFIGALADGQAAAVHDALAGMPPYAAIPPWRIDRLGQFGSARVLWAGSAPEAVPDWLRGLAAQVRTRLSALDVAHDRRRFIPHVTLLRGLPRAALAAPLEPAAQTIAWPGVEGADTTTPPATAATGAIDPLRPRLLVTQPPGVLPRYRDFTAPSSA